MSYLDPIFDPGSQGETSSEECLTKRWRTAVPPMPNIQEYHLPPSADTPDTGDVPLRPRSKAVLLLAAAPKSPIGTMK
jgi:hypothetical protein